MRHALVAAMGGWADWAAYIKVGQLCARAVNALLSLSR